jgi:phosphoserine aminotransferase
MTVQQPSIKPKNPCFSSGPCAKRPGWTLAGLEAYALPGRSHRSSPGKKACADVITLHREILRIPDDYRIGIVPASDTGAVEMAMWGMLGDIKDGGLGVDMHAIESFSGQWLDDVVNHLKLKDVRKFEAPYGGMTDLSSYDGSRDVVFAWNGTTGGSCVPNADWIPTDRSGVTICDATSAVFGYDMPWDKLDVTTWSWQKALGSEAAHGMIVLSPRAVARLESFVPEGRPLPKVFRMTKKGKLIDSIFEGLTINTPSMLCVADVLDALYWVKSIGGVDSVIARSKASYEAVKEWVLKSDWAEFIVEDEAVRSRMSICLCVKDQWFLDRYKDKDAQVAFVKGFLKELDVLGVGYDLAMHADAPAGIRIWCGATVEPSDVAALLPWFDWAYAKAKAAAHS